MSWNPQMEVHYVNTSYPYSTAGSFMEYFEGLTYEHVNFIFSGASHGQESVYPSMNTNSYKFGFSEPGSTSYYDHGHTYVVNDHEPRIDEYRRPFENSSTMINEQTAAIHTDTEWEGNARTTTQDNHIECPRRHQNSNDYQVIWQDNIDPDNMTYEGIYVVLGRGRGALQPQWLIGGNIARIETLG